MSNLSPNSAKRWWLAAALWLLAIYATLYWVRFINDWLRERNLLRITVLVAYVLAAIAILAWLRRRRAGRRELAAFFVALAAYAAVLVQVRYVVERLHFLEYGVLAGLIYAALRAGQGRAGPGADGAGPKLRAAAWAVALTGLCGWVDELVQAVLPGRFYSLRDVALNVAAAVLAVLSIITLTWARDRDRAARSA